jgi:phosphoesterase RecJ-like protein
MNTSDITQIKDLLIKPKNIIIVCHSNPDGDAIGSSLGLYHYLNKKEHLVTVVVPNDYPNFLKWMTGDNSIVKYDTETEKSEALINKADIIFTLDFNAFHRTRNMETVLSKSDATKIMIDHHQQPDDYAAFMYSDVLMSSTCQMVYHFIEKLDDLELIDENIATCLYVGIMTDTGSFRFPSTTSITHKVIADLIEKGANNSYIHNNVYNTNSQSRLRLLGCALSNLKVIPEMRTAFITLSQDELDTNNFKKGDTEGFVNYGLSLESIIFAAIFIENKQDNIIKISFRSKGDFSVNEFSRAHFSGGGHTNAAGGKSDLDLKETITKFERLLTNYKTQLFI